MNCLTVRFHNNEVKFRFSNFNFSLSSHKYVLCMLFGVACMHVKLNVDLVTNVVETQV